MLSSGVFLPPVANSLSVSVVEDSNSEDSSCLDFLEEEAKYPLTLASPRICLGSPSKNKTG